MYEETKEGLDEAQVQAKEAGRTILETNRKALRSYLRAAFQLQRAGLEAVEALQRGAEELTFNLVDRAEDAQQTALERAEQRLRESVEQLREARERSTEVLRENNERLRARAEELQSQLQAEQDDLEEAGDLAENRLREGAEIALKVAKVIETRIETMLTELVELGRREMDELEERIDALVNRLDEELEDEIHPIANYDDKTVAEIEDELDRLDEMQLRIVRAHESRHKNRVTVLRAIDERLAQEDGLEAALGSRKTLTEQVEDRVREVEARVDAAVERMEREVNGLVNPIPNYDEKNADEVRDALGGLNAMQLGQLRAYELANKNRVTVLRAIDDRLADQAQAESA